MAASDLSALALEYESVLKRGVEQLGLSLGDIDDFMEYLCSRARLVQIYFRWRPMLPDPADHRILEVAVRTGSPIVTFNVRHFRGSESPGIRTMSPGKLLAIMERLSRENDNECDRKRSRRVVPPSLRSSGIGEHLG